MTKQVLVVEDSGHLARGWARKLSDNLHVDVTVVTLESEAMRLIKERDFDVVVSGYYFSVDEPDEGFSQIMSAIRAKDRPIPVIFMASYVLPQDSFAAAKLGAFDFVVLNLKTESSVLIKAVRSALELCRIPRVFISYSSKDRPFAEKLAAKLLDHGWQVWYDQWEIKVGDSIIERIEQGITSSSYLIILLSEASVTSKWVQEEIHAAFVRQLEGKESKVLPALIEDCNIPPFLRSKKYADFRSSFDEGIQQIVMAITA
jgi:CheY-like chemotaxis protein